MLSLLRAVAVIGAIAYLSPMRGGEAAAPALPRLDAPAPRSPAPPAVIDVEALDRFWSRLPQEARKAVVDDVLRAARDEARQAARQALAAEPERRRPADMLRPEDRIAPWNGPAVR